MKISWYFAAATAIATAQASPHPAFEQQQPLGSSSTSSQTSVVHSDDMSSLSGAISKDPLLSFHRDLVNTDSVSGNEHDVGIFLAEYLEARNFTVVKQEVPPVDRKEGGGSYSSKPRYNIYAYPSSQSKPPSVLVTSHIDTVPPFIPYSIHEPKTQQSASKAAQLNLDDLVLAGRGTVDAKGCVATQTFAALDTLEKNPDARLALLFVVGEEIGGDGMKVFSDSALNSNGAYHTVIFGEPTEAALAGGHKGMLGFEVLAHGQAAHSGYPWLGKSAVSSILPALTRVDKLGDIPASEGGLPASPKYGHTTLNIGVIRAGVATNVVPASARADVAVRLAAGTPNGAREIIRRAVADATRDVDADVEVDFTTHRESYAPQDLDTDVPGFDVITVNYGTDVPNLQVPSGVKRYLYGTGTIFVAHGDNEGLAVHELKGAVDGYKKLIEAALERE